MDPVPPVIPPTSSPEPPPLPLSVEGKISPIVWVRWALVAVFFIALTFSTVAEIDSEPVDLNAPSSSDVLELKMALTVINMETGARPLAPTRPDSGGLSQGDGALRSLELKLEPKGRKNDESAALLAFVQSVRTEIADPEVLQRLATSKQEELRPLAKLYGRKKLSEAELQVLKTETSELPEIGRFIALSVNEYEGDYNARKREFPVTDLIGILGMVGILTMGGLLGVVVWTMYFSMRKRPSWAPQGHFFDSLTSEEGSKLGLIGAGCVGMFVIVQGIAVAATASLDESVQMILATLTFLALLFALLAVVPVGGRPFLKWLNQSQFSVGKQIGIGLLGWAANLPVLLILLGVMSRVIQDANPSHPATEMISSGGPLMLIAVLLAATISAPIWEEIVFRGALFGGMRSTLRSKPWGLWVSIVLSSLAFAAIHPQGPALWIGLGWIGAMGCFLSYYTRSIIASITMHAMHNGTLMGLSYFLLR